MGTVMKLPPLMWAVKVSLRRRKGKIAHREYSPIESRKLRRVVRRMPNQRERTRFIIASTMPLSTTSRKKSIRKKSTAPWIVLSPSATKKLKKMG